MDLTSVPHWALLHAAKLLYCSCECTEVKILQSGIGTGGTIDELN